MSSRTTSAYSFIVREDADAVWEADALTRPLAKRLCGILKFIVDEQSPRCCVMQADSVAFLVITVSRLFMTVRTSQ